MDANRPGPQDPIAQPEPPAPPAPPAPPVGQLLDLPPGPMELRFTPELLAQIETELAEVETAIETLQLDRVVSR